MITILTTGGTFDKIYFDAKSDFHIGDTMVSPLLEEGNVTFSYHTESVLKKDSLEITDEDRQTIAAAVQQQSASKIIITHGTDTMTDTAKVLAETIAKDKTVVFVGAMQPARMRYTDAPFNLGFACAAVQLLKPGIYVAMNGHIFPYDQVKKNRDKSRFELG